jgi:hypothetical protein
MLRKGSLMSWFSGLRFPKFFPIFSKIEHHAWQSACRAGKMAQFRGRSLPVLPSPLRRWLATVSLMGATISGWSTAKGEWCIRSSVASPIEGGPDGWSLLGLAWWEGRVYYVMAVIDGITIATDIYFPNGRWMKWLGIWRMQVFAFPPGRTIAVNAYIRRTTVLRLIYHVDTDETTTFDSGVLTREYEGTVIRAPIIKWLDGLIALRRVLTPMIERE